MMDDPLKDKPRLGDEALGPCGICKRVILATEVPVFYRLRVGHCGVDANAVRERVGLAQMMGGGADGLALAGIMGPGTKPVIEMDSGEVNICQSCASNNTSLIGLLMGALEKDDEDG